MPSAVAIEKLGVEVSGGTLAAYRLGAGPVGAPLVLAVHGITSNSRAWISLARALGARAQLVAVDLRGRAASNRLPGPYGIGAHTADLLAVLDRLEAERAVLVGHSLGAYVVARFGVEHPQRLEAAVMVDGGLTIPGSEDADPEQFAEAFLGPTLARMRLTFPNREAYHDWWRRHPAFGGSDIADEDLVAYADHDLVGTEPELRCSVAAPAVRADAVELAGAAAASHRLEVPATLLVAPRGLQNEPHPMQPLELAQAWAAEAPERRRARLVEGVNHYSIALGATGAAAVAQALAATLAA